MKKDKIVTYSIILTPIQEKNLKYLVTVPALVRETQGKDMTDAIKMGKDLIGSMSLVEELPNDDVETPTVKKDELVKLVTVNISKYRRENIN